MPDTLTICTHKELFTEQLKQIAPYVFSENGIDINLLHKHLGIDDANSNEQYSFNWVGKNKAIRTLQQKTLSLLLPDIAKSLDFQNTKNVFIEGDNLEVLKIMQKSYFESVDLIYIDPPYNTGKDFVYSDKYEDSLKTYLEYSGLLGSSNAFGKDAQTGRKHSNWLSMMYPRLVLAKNLLTNSGIIAISIGPEENANLIKLCNEVFGEENFIQQITVKSNPRGKQQEFVPSCGDYLLLYAKNIDFANINGLGLTLEDLKEYNKTDLNGKRFRELGLRKRGADSKRTDSPTMFYPIYVDSVNGQVSNTKTSRHNIEVIPKLETGEDGRWRWGIDTVGIDNPLLFARQVKTKGTSTLRWDVFQIDYASTDEGDKTKKANSIWDDTSVNTENGTKALKDLFGTNSELFNFPKPVALLEKIIALTTDTDAVILDFFGGSGTTAHAVMSINYNTSSNRSYVCVQLDEIPSFGTTSKDIAKQHAFTSYGFKAISDLTIERIKRAGKLYAGIDTGYRHYSLPKKLPTIEQAISTVEELKAQVLPVKTYSCAEEVITEMLLKRGLRLSVSLEMITNNVYKVADGGKIYYLCVETGNVDLTLIKSICAYANTSDEVIFIESAFSLDGKLNAFNLLEQQHGLVVGLI